MTWTTQDSAELYGVPHWGEKLFRVNERGHLVIVPRAPRKGELDLSDLADDLADRGVDLPVLVRVPDVARRRMELLVRAFQKAFHEHGYQGRYRGVYPIKVNQQRRLVEELLTFGSKHHFGLEAGSKSELLVALAMLDDPDALLICNGYKDRRYVETALLARQLGRDTIVVVEKLSELPTILAAGERLGIRPRIGVRAKLSSPGKGRWSGSSGDRAKFGLSAADIGSLVESLREADCLDCLQLLHFHIGSQVSSSGTLRRALREAGRLYTELTRLGAPMGVLDVGGGLAVDYDGSRTDFECSRNYSEAEYAANVVAEIGAACDSADVPHPDLVTESGRATVAHCSVLLFEVMGKESLPEGRPDDLPEDAPALLAELHEVHDRVNARAYQEAWHDANDVRRQGQQAFVMGLIDLPTLAAIDRLFWQTCRRIQHVASKQRYVPDDLDDLAPALADTYYANFSLFSSAVDSWAIGQLFPCLPVQRLDEKPDRLAVLADLTCDSDGKIDRFVDRRDVKKALEVHSLRPGERYVMALTLVGAYQEILGGHHNLFGSTHAAHVSLDEDGNTHIDRVIDGETVSSVIGSMQYDPRELIQRVRTASDAAIRSGRLPRSQAAALLAAMREGFAGYTYLGQDREQSLQTDTATLSPVKSAATR